MTKLTTALLLVGLLAPAASAQAASVIPLPGHSEADQYYETVPDPAAPRSPNPERSVEDAVADGLISAEDADALQEAGESGESLATAVAQTAPSGSDEGRAGARDEDQAGDAAGEEGEAGAPAGPAADDAEEAITERQGIGGLLPALLAALSVGAAAYLLVQWQRSRGRTGRGSA